MTQGRSWSRGGAPTVRRRTAIGFAGLGVAAAVVAACGGDSEKEKGATGAGAQPSAAAGGTQAAKPQRGGVLTLSVGAQMGTLHPQRAGGSGEARYAIYDHLFLYDYDNGAYELSAASSLEQPEPTRIIFKIKPTAKFQQLPPANGRAVTGEDVVLSWQTYAADPTTTGAKTIFTQDTDRLETPDASTVVVQMKRPNAWTIGPHGLAGPIPTLFVPKELAGSDQLEKVAVGSGAYHLESFDPTSSIAFTRRPDGWHDDRPYIDRVVYRVITDETARAAAFRGKQIDQLLARDKLQADEFKDFGKGMVIDKKLDFPRMMWLRADREPFNDIRARQAIYAALDTKDLIQRVDLGEGEYSGPVPPHLPKWSLPEAELKSYFPSDPKKARDLLTAAGWDFNREIEYKFPSDPKSQLLAEVVQKQLAAAGIKTKLVPEDPNTVWAAQTMRNAAFQITSTGRRFLGQDPDVWLRYWTTEGASGMNDSRWGIKEIDEAVKRQQLEFDAAKQKALIIEIQQRIFKEAGPIINLFSPYTYTGRWDYFHAVTDRGYVGTLGQYAWMEPKR